MPAAGQNTPLIASPLEISCLESSKILENLFIPFCSENTEGKKSISQIQNKKIKIPSHDKPLKRTHSQVTEKGSQTHAFRASSEFKMETDLVEVDSAETDFHSPLHIAPIQNNTSALIPHREIFSSASSLNQAPTPKEEIDFFLELQEIAKTLVMSEPIKKKLTNDSSDPINIFTISQNQQQKSTPTKKQTKINNKFSKKTKVASQNQICSSQQNLNTGDNDNPATQKNNSSKTRKPRQQKQPKQLSISSNKLLNKKSKNPQKLVFAEEVYLKTLSEDGSIKLKKFPCFKESDLCIPNQYSQLIQQYSDDDKCSGDELLEKAVNFLHKKLVASTLEMNPSAKILDSDKVLTIKDIKIDRDSDDEDEEDEQDEEQDNKYHSSQQFSRRYSYSSKKTHNSYLSEDEDSDDDVHINSFSN